MPTLPIPMISSLVLGFMVIQALSRSETNKFLTCFIGLCAIQGTVISLAQHYNVEFFLKLQPVTAAIIPAFGWIAFQTTTKRAFNLSRDWVHILPALFTGFCVVMTPYLSLSGFRFIMLDLFIPGIFIGYGLAMLMVLSKGADSLPLMRLSAGEAPTFIWRIIAIALIGSAFTDALIVALQILDKPSWQPWVISIYTSATLIVIGALSLSRNLLTTDHGGKQEEPAPTEEIVQQDKALMDELTRFMESEKIYLDPDLTLNRLSRRLRIPSKQISSSVNRSTGENVSRFINSYRIDVACRELTRSKNVTTAMLASGFNTKSNFNREFRRIKNYSPSEWMERPDQT